MQFSAWKWYFIKCFVDIVDFFLLYWEILRKFFIIYSKMAKMQFSAIAFLQICAKILKVNQKSCNFSLLAAFLLQHRKRPEFLNSFESVIRPNLCDHKVSYFSRQAFQARAWYKAKLARSPAPTASAPGRVSTKIFKM